MDGLSVRQFALKEKLSLGSVYRRLWQGQLRATKLDGRWLILSETAGRGNTGVDGEVRPGETVMRERMPNCGER